MVPTHEEGSSRTKRVLLTAFWAAVAIVFVADVAWLLITANSGPDEPKQTEIEPAQETTAPAMPSVITSGSATATAAPGSTTTPVGDATADSPRTVRAPRIAYRLGTTLYVANEDGSQPSPVARIAEGPYALSPDGLTMAVVTEGRLKLLDTASGATIDVRDAIDVTPVWMPNSRAVLFVRRDGHIDEVRRVKRDGSGDTAVRQGSGVSVSPNGRVVVVRASGAVLADDYVWVSVSGSAFRRVKLADGFVTAIAAADKRLYVGMADASGAAWIVAVAPDGSGATRFAQGPAEDERADWGELCLSPDGKNLGAVALGDDEYSRISIFTLPNGDETRLNLRRDAYARCWSSAGDYLYFVEGNAYQGEPTVLYRIAPDGTGRRVVATGAR